MEIREDLDTLRQKTELYLEESQRMIEEKKWVLAAIALHQHCEYLLKYKALQLTGTVPKTHSLKSLIKFLEKHNVMVRQLLLDRTYSFRLTRIEGAYLLSKITSVKYNRDVLLPLFDFTRDVFDNLVGGISP